MPGSIGGISKHKTLQNLSSFMRPPFPLLPEAPTPLSWFSSHLQGLSPLVLWIPELCLCPPLLALLPTLARGWLTSPSFTSPFCITRSSSRPPIPASPRRSKTLVAHSSLLVSSAHPQVPILALALPLTYLSSQVLVQGGLSTPRQEP